MKTPELDAFDHVLTGYQADVAALRRQLADVKAALSVIREIAGNNTVAVPHNPTGFGGIYAVADAALKASEPETADA